MTDNEIFNRMFELSCRAVVHKDETTGLLRDTLDELDSLISGQLTETLKQIKNSWKENGIWYVEYEDGEVIQSKDEINWSRRT